MGAHVFDNMGCSSLLVGIVVILACVSKVAGHGAHASPPGPPPPPCDSTTENCESLPYGLAWGMNIGAAVSTLIGAGAVVCSPSLRKVLMDPTSPVLVSLLSLSFGVLLWVSLVVLQPEAAKTLEKDGVKGYNLITSAVFFAGWGLGYLLGLASKQFNTPAAPLVAHDDSKVEFTDGDGDVLIYRLVSGSLQLLINGKVALSPVEHLTWDGQNRNLRDSLEATPLPESVDVAWIQKLAESSSAPNCAWLLAKPDEAAEWDASASNRERKAKQESAMLNMACHTAMSLALHNFAEGFVTFVAVIADKSVGVATGIAIMLHNIPEGFVIAVPAWAATKDWKRPLLFTSFATAAEVVAGFIAYMVVKAIDDYSSDNKGIVWMQAVLSSLAAGIMAQASLGSLFPHCLEMERRRRIAVAEARASPPEESVGAPPINKTAAEVGLEVVSNPVNNAHVSSCSQVKVPDVADAGDDESGDMSVVLGWTLVGMVLMAIVLGLFDIEDM